MLVQGGLRRFGSRPAVGDTWACFVSAPFSARFAVLKGRTGKSPLLVEGHGSPPNPLKFKPISSKSAVFRASFGSRQNIIGKPAPGTRRVGRAQRERCHGLANHRWLRQMGWFAFVNHRWLKHILHFPLSVHDIGLARKPHNTSRRQFREFVSRGYGCWTSKQMILQAVLA